VAHELIGTLARAISTIRDHRGRREAMVQGGLCRAGRFSWNDGVRVLLRSLTLATQAGSA